MNFLEIAAHGSRAIINGYKSHAPQILTGICVSGIFGTAITSTIGTVKACKKIEEIKLEKGVEKLTTKEVVKACWKYYIPTFVTAVGSAAAGIESCNKSSKANAILATMLQTTEASKNDILDAAEEVVGKKKKEEIESVAASNAIAKNPPTSDNIYKTPYGDYLFMEGITGLYFRSSQASVKDGVRMFNMMVRNACQNGPAEGEVTFEDLFERWGVEFFGRKPKILNNTWCTHEIDVHFVYDSHNITGEPCAVISYSGKPPFDLESIAWNGDWD